MEFLTNEAPHHVKSSPICAQVYNGHSRRLWARRYHIRNLGVTVMVEPELVTTGALDAM